LCLRAVTGGGVVALQGPAGLGARFHRASRPAIPRLPPARTRARARGPSASSPAAAPRLGLRFLVVPRCLPGRDLLSAPAHRAGGLTQFYALSPPPCGSRVTAAATARRARRGRGARRRRGAARG